MSELTDFEICKRIAEIEGIEFEVNHRGDVVNIEVGLRRFFNPLTDKALCFDLMLKYGICISKVSPKKFVTRYGLFRGKESENPQRAICLTIIAIDKEQ